MYVKLCLFVLALHNVYAKNLLELMKENPKLSQATAIVEGDEMLNVQFRLTGCTAFIPDDDAMDAFTGVKDAELINNHISNAAKMIEELEDTINSGAPGNPELHVTKISNGKRRITSYEDYDYYINNAMVTTANLKATSKKGNPQVLHIIDEVVGPTRTVGSAQSLVEQPNAFDVISKHRSYGLVDETSISTFFKRVQELQQTNVFNEEGEFTFFVPVDSALSDAQVLDKQIIHGHVVPDMVLFTKPATVEVKEEQSLAFTDNLEVLIKMERVHSVASNRTGYYVSSHTVAADQQHPKGTAMARIIRGNIPVSNGVIHLIDRPLMSTAKSIMSYLMEKDGQLSQFYKLFSEYQKGLLDQLAGHSEKQAMTLFAPSNAAFEVVKQKRLEEVTLNSNKLSELLKLHMVHGRLTTEQVMEQVRIGKMYESSTLSNGRMIYLSATGINDNAQPIYTVSGAGVNASISTPNIIAENGVIHIIDRIMDIPSQTVYEMLQSSPGLSTTFNMSVQDGFANQFSDRSKKFTMFVPNNAAWEQIKTRMPSSFQKLIMGDYAYHVKQILQRHMLVGKDLSIKALTALTNNRTLSPNEPDRQAILDMTRGKVHFEFQVEGIANEYSVEWKGQRARVVQSDLECVNGVIHIIDNVLMSRDDVTVAGATTFTATTLFTSLLTLAMTVLMR